MKIYKRNDWNADLCNLKQIHILPRITVSLYKDNSFESLRVSWVVFTLGVYK